MWGDKGPVEEETFNLRDFDSTRLDSYLYITTAAIAAQWESLNYLVSFLAALFPFLSFHHNGGLHRS